MRLESLAPQSVFHYFEEICSIPHGSGNTKAISDYCVRFAQEHSLKYKQDAFNNVVIYSPASPGYESSNTIILQGHLDMVCAADSSCTKDMYSEGLDLFIDGDLIGAIGTTLGGDDGIAIAMILAVLSDHNLSHPPLEALFTVDEETGMYGAIGLDPSCLFGRTMVNLDSEEEGVFTVSCAGGARVTLQWDVNRNSTQALPVQIQINGLLGGHSGVEINEGRANANILMGRILRALHKTCKVQLVSICGGVADNAIPSSCSATIAVGQEDIESVLETIEKYAIIIQNEYTYSDNSISIVSTVEDIQSLSILSDEDTKNIISALTLSPNGVQTMSLVNPGLPESSLNLGIISLESDQATLHFSVRSSVSSRKQTIIDILCCIAETCGAYVNISGDYPAWEYMPLSPLRDRMVNIYESLFGTSPQVIAIHAGLECGILSEKMHGLDCVSCGPNIYNIHTPSERLSISSVQRTWSFLLELLRQSM